MQEKPRFTRQNVAILIEMVYALGVKRARPTNNAMHFITFAEQKFS